MREVNTALLVGLVGVLLAIPACFLTHRNSSGDEGAAGSGVEAGTDANVGFEHPREVYFSSGDLDYDYWEGTSGKNNCTRDQDCLISGCHDSTCAAEVVEINDEEFCKSRELSSYIGPGPPFGSCGCLNKECQWYFENDFDRHCETDDDCNGLGPPPEGIRKAVWYCRNNGCHFGFPDGAGGAGGTGGDGGSGGGTSFLDGGIGDCSEPAEGCPCEPGTPPVACDIDAGAGWDRQGIRRCRDGRWTVCESAAAWLP